MYGFSSEKKMASVLTRSEHGYRLYNKASITLANCIGLDASRSEQKLSHDGAGRRGVGAAELHTLLE